MPNLKCPIYQNHIRNNIQCLCTLYRVYLLTARKTAMSEPPTSSLSSIGTYYLTTKFRKEVVPEQVTSSTLVESLVVVT
jgi:hypothetical protein